MLYSSRDIRVPPAALILFFILTFYDFAIVLLRNKDVAHKYRNYSGEIPNFYLYSHLRYILSLAFTVVVYFLTNWKRTGMLLILRLLLKTAFFDKNSSYYFFVHFPRRN